MMQWTNSKLRYGALPQAVHWLTALFVVAGFLLGQFGDDLPKPYRGLGLLIHMTFGECVFVLLLVRLAWRFIDPPPPAEITPFGRLVDWAAKLSHFALYALLIVVPFLGVMVQLKRGHDLPIFALWDFASPWPADRPTARTAFQVHSLLADALLILAGLHACAAIVHHHVWRDRTLLRMLPARQQSKRAYYRDVEIMSYGILNSSVLVAWGVSQGILHVTCRSFPRISHLRACNRVGR